jgi:hypothetical protein
MLVRGDSEVALFAHLFASRLSVIFPRLILPRQSGPLLVLEFLWSLRFMDWNHLMSHVAAGRAAPPGVAWWRAVSRRLDHFGARHWQTRAPFTGPMLPRRGVRRPVPWAAAAETSDPTTAPGPPPYPPQFPTHTFNERELPTHSRCVPQLSFLEASFCRRSEAPIVKQDSDSPSRRWSIE